jgi:hypothetical protein
MSGDLTPEAGSHGHRHFRLAAMLLVVILLACLGTYWTTVTFTPLHSPAAAAGTNRTIVVYHNTTVFQNTTRNVTTPIFHNTTVWQNSTAYENGTVFHTTTVYVNTTQVVMLPVVNLTGISWMLDPTGPFAGKISADLVSPLGAGSVHSYPLGVVMWILVNVTNNATTSGHLDISPASPFVLVDSQPSMPHTIPAASTMTFELSIGVPYTPGAYALELDVTVK